MDLVAYGDLQDAIYEAAEQAAYVELGGIHTPTLTSIDRADAEHAYLAERKGPYGGAVAACLVAVVFEDTLPVGKILASYTHAAGELGDGGPDDNPYHPDEATALERARELSLKHRSRVFEVWPIERGGRVALVHDGEIYRAS